MKVFADANILFSASKKDSLVQRLLAAVRERGALVTNPHALEEARRNLELKQAGWLEEFDRLCSSIEIAAAIAGVADLPVAEKDQPILAGAIAARSTHLLTGDRTHFGQHYCQTVQGVHIISPQMLAEELQGG